MSKPVPQRSVDRLHPLGGHINHDCPVGRCEKVLVSYHLTKVIDRHGRPLVNLPYHREPVLNPSEQAYLCVEGLYRFPVEGRN